MKQDLTDKIQNHRD